jgi:DnaJ-class molecular chaperone
MPGKAFGPSRGDRLPLVSTSGDDATASACFADDVIIDFPSVAPALARMRSAFLEEERGAPVSAAVRVALSDATLGATIPLSVPVRRTCRSCGGRGESWTEACRRCEGSGAELLVYELQLTLPPGVADGTRVQFTVTPPQTPPTRVDLIIAVA